jgi:5'-nucleotidase
LHYWLSVKRIDELEEGTDRWAMRNGLVAMTPMRLDLTDEVALDRVKGPVDATA